MNKIKVCCDVDGVLLNFLQSVSNFIESKYKLSSKIKYGTTQWSLYERFNQQEIDKIDFSVIKNEFEINGGWEFLEPMPNIELIQELVRNPLFNVSFLTSIPVHLHDQRLKNLSSVLGINLNSDQLTCVAIGESKKVYLDKIAPDFFVEDTLNNLKSCQGNHISYWINLKEDGNNNFGISEMNIVEVENLNEAITKIKNTLINTNINKMIEKVKLVLDDSLLNSKYKNMIRSSESEGHCYASSEAIFHMLGGKVNGLVPQVASFRDNGVNVTHWWLKDKNGNIIDPTADQFYTIGKKPPYELGKGSGFLTKYPSKRAFEIINRVVNEVEKTSQLNLR